MHDRKSQGYFYYDPYKLVKADVLGVESWVPDDTAHWLKQHYGQHWRVRNSRPANSRKSQLSTRPPVLPPELKHDKEWWVQQGGKSHGLVPLSEAQLARRSQFAVSTDRLRLPSSVEVARPTRRCDMLSQSRFDSRMMPSDWAIQRQELGALWHNVSAVLAEAGAWHHIDWTTLIAWERDCDFNFRTNALVVVVSATNYSTRWNWNKSWST